jgi:hypothetical protein
LIPSDPRAALKDADQLQVQPIGQTINDDDLPNGNFVSFNGAF